MKKLIGLLFTLVVSTGAFIWIKTDIFGAPSVTGSGGWDALFIIGMALVGTPIALILLIGLFSMFGSNTLTDRARNEDIEKNRPQ